jgi:uncharacterized protein (UPF0332 family)
MEKIDWCKKQKRGIRKIEPSSNVAKDYFSKADNSLAVMESSPNDEWKVISAYYACYNSIYALLQKAGIKCEIHDCTLALMVKFDFSDTEISFMKELIIARHNAQYYTDKPFLTPNKDKVKDFVLVCKNKAEILDFNKIIEDIFKVEVEEK